MSDNLLAHVVAQTGLLATAGDAPECLKRTLATAVDAVKAEAGTVFLHDAEARKLRFFHAIGRGPDGKPAPIAFGLVGSSLGDDEGLAGRVQQSGEAEIVNDVAADPSHCERFDEDIQFTTRNVASIPLRHIDGSSIGVLQVLNKRDGDFSEDDVTTLSVLARILALAVDRAPTPAPAPPRSELDEE